MNDAEHKDIEERMGQQVRARADLIDEVTRLRAFVGVASRRFDDDLCCARHGEYACPSCLRYLLGDLKLAQTKGPLAVTEER